MRDMDGTAIARSLITGALSGLRSASGPALAAWQLRGQRTRRRDRLPRRLLASDHALEATGAMAVGEVLADKHPAMPNRTDPPALVGRAIAGAVAASALVGRRAPVKVVVAHALLGAGAAVLGAYLGYYARRAATEHSGAPAMLIAAAEDALTYAGGALAIRGVSRR